MDCASVPSPPSPPNLRRYANKFPPIAAVRLTHPYLGSNLPSFINMAPCIDAIDKALACSIEAVSLHDWVETVAQHCHYCFPGPKLMLQPSHSGTDPSYQVLYTRPTNLQNNHPTWSIRAKTPRSLLLAEGAQWDRQQLYTSFAQDTHHRTSPCSTYTQFPQLNLLDTI